MLGALQASQVLSVPPAETVKHKNTNQTKWHEIFQLRKEQEDYIGKINDAENDK